MSAVGFVTPADRIPALLADYARASRLPYRAAPVNSPAPLPRPDPLALMREVAEFIRETAPPEGRS